MNTYRTDESDGKVYKWEESQNAYVFIGNLNGRTERQFIEDIQDVELEYSK